MRYVSVIIAALVFIHAGCSNSSRELHKRTFDETVFSKVSPRSDEVLVIGFSPVTYDTSLSTLGAIENGLTRLALYLGVDIQDTTVSVYQSTFGSALNSNTKESVVNAEKILGISAYVRILGISENSSIKSVALGVSHPSFSELSKTRFPSILSVVKPAWVDTIPESKEYIYGVGISLPWYDLLGGMRTAEQNARKALAQQIEVQVMSKGELEEYTKTLKVNREIITTTKMILEGAELYDLWEDPEKGITYALVRMKIRNKE